MPDTRTIGQLLKCGAVTRSQVEAAVSAYLVNQTRGLREIAPGIHLDIAAAVEANAWARIFVTASCFNRDHRRAAVEVVILLAEAEYAIFPCATETRAP